MNAPLAPARPHPVLDPSRLDAPPTIGLRLARPDDAAYIYGLRIDPTYNRHLSPPPPSVEQQRRYLEGYLTREAAGSEYYFVIDNRRTGAPCGVVRLYDLRPDSFSWGSWILDAGKTRTAALESALFVYDVGFGLLGFPSSHFEVRKENTGVISFHERFGAVRTGEDEDSFQFRLDADVLRDHLPRLSAVCHYQPAHLAP